MCESILFFKGILLLCFYESTGNFGFLFFKESMGWEFFLMLVIYNLLNFINVLNYVVYLFMLIKRLEDIIKFYEV